MRTDNEFRSTRRTTAATALHDEEAKSLYPSTRVVVLQNYEKYKESCTEDGLTNSNSNGQVLAIFQEQYNM
jgi:SET domain-containing protein